MARTASSPPPSTDLGAPRGRAALAALAWPVTFVVLWSSGYLVGEIATREAPPLSILFWRFASAGAILVVVAVATRAPWPHGARAWGHLLLTGVLLQTTQFAGVYLGLSLGVSAGLAALVLSASPLAIAVLGVPLFAERLVGRQWIGLVLGLAGVGLAVSAEPAGAGSVAGVLLLVLGLSGFVAGTLYQKRFGAEMDLRTGLAVQLLGASLAAAPVSLLVGGGLGMPLTAPALGALAWIALVNSIGGFTFLFVLLRRRPGAAATSYLFLVPPVTALIAVPLLGQPVTTGALAGILVAGVGVALVTRPARPAAGAERSG